MVPAGSCRVLAEFFSELVNTFTVSCEGWVDDNPPITFTYGYEDRTTGQIIEVATPPTSSKHCHPERALEGVRR
eukprot:1776192-Rhodomonas_salina.5